MDLPASPSALQPSSREDPREQLRHFSKLVFGNKDRLEVAAAIARSPDGFVNATDLQRELQLAQSRVRNQLVAFAEAGLLSTFPKAGPKLWYQRLDSPLWDTCLALYEDKVG